MDETHDEKKKLLCCPRCGDTGVITNMVKWYAHSLEPQDIMNASILQEHQCVVCCRSFWT